MKTEKTALLRSPVPIIDYAVCLALIVAFISSMLLHQPGHNWGDDFALYIHQAQALLSGEVPQLVSENTFMVRQSDMQFGPEAYPWGFPIMLAPVISIAGPDFAVLKMLESLFFVLAMGCYYLLARRFIPKSWAFAGMLLLAFNNLYLHHTSNVLTEFPFLLLMLLSLLCAERFFRRQHWRYAIILGGLSWFTFLIRTEGIVLLPAYCYAVWSARQDFSDGGWRWQKIMLVSIPPATWFLLDTLAGALLPRGFASHMEITGIGSLDTLRENWQYYPAKLTWMLTGFKQYILFFTLFFVCMLTGLYRLRTSAAMPAAVMVQLGVILLAWPFREHRYLFAFLPFALLFATAGLQLAATRLKWLGAVVLIPAIFVLILHLHSDFIHIRRNLASPAVMAGPMEKDSRDMFRFIKEKTDKKDVIAFFRPRAMHLYAERRSLVVINNPLALVRSAQYYVFRTGGNNFYQQDTAFLRYRPFNSLQTVYRNPSFIVYKIPPHVQ
ncbi:glycosyltransferase family 39 protein [Chitinophaga deserti]|uniref:glycosyltransferase family 39 protein n=1 Tax=Chitinophaga deserti TaxID=2164099 RepID=UPI000D6B1CF3|nr:glycosyltransferase family 39 protein [Chitinophaga deserti]